MTFYKITFKTKINLDLRKIEKQAKKNYMHSLALDEFMFKYTCPTSWRPEIGEFENDIIGFSCSTDDKFVKRAEIREWVKLKTSKAAEVDIEDNLDLTGEIITFVTSFD